MSRGDANAGGLSRSIEFDADADAAPVAGAPFPVLIDPRRLRDTAAEDEDGAQPHIEGARPVGARRDRFGVGHRRGDRLLLYRRQKICADQLERRGFYIAKGVRRLAMSTKNKIRASQSWDDVFNGKDRDGNLTYDGSRKQTRGNEPWHEEVLPLLEADFRALGVLACSDGREKALNRLVSLKSTRCRTKGKQHQPRHADSAQKDSLRGELPHDVPLAALLAIQGRTQLHVWPFDTDKEEIVELEDGDLLIFRGDLGHAGAEYNEEDMHGGVHLRLHVYIDSPLIERQMDSDGVPLTFPF